MIKSQSTGKDSMCRDGFGRFTFTGWLLYGGPVITKAKEPFLVDSSLFKYRVLLDIVLRRNMSNLKAVAEKLRP